MNILKVARYVSVLAFGALAVGCGHRSEGAGENPHALTPAACVPVPEGTAKAPEPAKAASPAKTVAQAEPKAEEKQAAKPAKVKVKTLDAPLRVRRLVVAEGVERGRREPVGAASSFKASDVDKLYAFVEIENPNRADSEVFVTFEPDGEGPSQGQVTLDVGAAPRWRTWAYTRGVKKAGSWAAVVRSADGTVLARTPFEVTL
ncbi:MAG: DUF2914 domain-containing protein [Polyangiaceae bacterium]